jgi:antagonist of KipI
MDQFSFRVGNLLVGNPPGAAAVELTLMGAAFEALADLTVAITGADLAAHLNDQPAPTWTSLQLRRGDRVAFRRPVKGCRAYLAVRGGLDGPVFYGSRSTFVRGGMGRPLQAKDTLHVLSAPDEAAPPRSLAPEWRPTLGGEQRIRVILGPQADRFTARGLETFLASPYRLSPQSDRQGLRTDGPPIEMVRGPDIISDPTPLGAIQIAGDGKPLILHRDGQVTGGYAKIAVAASADLDRLARLLPGDRVTFAVTDAAGARALTTESAARERELARRFEIAR